MVLTAKSAYAMALTEFIQMQVLLRTKHADSVDTISDEEQAMMSLTVKVNYV